MRTAILVDGAFFLVRYQRLVGSRTPRDVAKAMHDMCLRHLGDNRKGRDGERHDLYRIFYYDCPPLSKKVHNPISGKLVDFGKTEQATWRTEFLKELKKLRLVAVRLGVIQEAGHWSLAPEKQKALIKRQISLDELTEQDIKYEMRQKGVDMRVGLDIASIAFKRQADRIVLVSGDSDFVPAAKLARREGIDFVLDPMWSPIRADLHEHIDGLRSVIPEPKRKKLPADHRR